MHVLQSFEQSWQESMVSNFPKEKKPSLHLQVLFSIIVLLAIQIVQVL
jgi:hypothetical protein